MNTLSNILRPWPLQTPEIDPESSIILPIYRGKYSFHYERLLQELSSQSYQDFEILVAHSVSPNGRARNEAVSFARGKYLVFIDETSRLAHERVVGNLIEALKADASIGIAGASCVLSDQATPLGKGYAKYRQFESPRVTRLTDSQSVQHVCMAMSKKIYQSVGGESNRLMTGTDNDLRQRVALAGYRMMLVPDTWIYYLPPKKILSMAKKSFDKGVGSAFAFLVYPGLFELSPRWKIRHPLAGLLYKVVSTASKFFRLDFLSNPVSLVCELALLTGFFKGWVQWLLADKDLKRADLLCPANEGRAS